MRAYGTGASFGGRQLTSGVKALIIANAAVFVLQTIFGGGLSNQISLVERWAAFVPDLAIFGGQVWRFGTYMFLHLGFFHLLFNMFLLWMFGSPVEALWGRRTFLIYYLVCGLGGAVLFGLIKIFGAESGVNMLGASGAVLGVLVAYGMSFPNNIILVFFVIPMKAKYAVILFGLMDLLMVRGGSGVAHWAHLGGMLTGYIFLRITTPSLAQGGGVFDDAGRAWRKFRARNRMRVVRPDEKGNGGDKPPAGEDQKRVDVILDKISREGLQSLTDEEQEILRRAGKR